MRQNWVTYLWILLLANMATVLPAQLNVQALYESNFISPDATNVWVEDFNTLYESSDGFSAFNFLNAFGMGLAYNANGSHIGIHAKKRFNRNTAENLEMSQVVGKASLSYSMNSYTGHFDFDIVPSWRFGMEASRHRIIHRFRFDADNIDNRIASDTWGYGAHLGYYYRSNPQSGFIIQVFGELIQAYDPDLMRLETSISSPKEDDILNFGIRLIFTNGGQY